MVTAFTGKKQANGFWATDDKRQTDGQAKLISHLGARDSSYVVANSWSASQWITFAQKIELVAENRTYRRSALVGAR